MASATGASLKVSASQPCSGKTGTLTAKAKRNASATQKSAPAGSDAAGGLVLQVGEVEVLRAGVEPENGDQQRRGGNEGEEEELERGAGAVLAAVHGDEDGHGHERELPEAVVEHQVERDEDAEHGGLLDEEERIEDLAARLDRVPTGEHADGREQAGEDDEPEAEAIDADVVEDGGALDPGDVALELEAGLAGGEVRGKMQREDEGDERGEQGDPVGQLGAVGQERDEDRAGQRNQQDERENRLVDAVIILSAPPSSNDDANERQSSGPMANSTNRSTAAAPSSQPGRVGAQIAGLPALQNRAGEAWRCRRAARRGRRGSRCRRPSPERILRR